MENSQGSPPETSGNFMVAVCWWFVAVLVHSVPTALVTMALWAMCAADGPRKGAAFMPLVLGGFLLFWQLRWLYQRYKNRQQVYGV